MVARKIKGVQFVYNLVLKQTFLEIELVADIDDTEVIWIALLRHAGKNTGST